MVEQYFWGGTTPPKKWNKRANFSILKRKIWNKKAFRWNRKGH